MVIWTVVHRRDNTLWATLYLKYIRFKYIYIYTHIYIPFHFILLYLSTFFIYRHLVRAAVCLACENNPEQAEEESQQGIECVYCRTRKQRREFDAMMLQRWTDSRKIASRACCKDCAANLGKTTHAPQRRTWRQKTYRCCISPLI